MKVGFFLLKFPLSSETFVLNQITAFIDMDMTGDYRPAKGRYPKHPCGVYPVWAGGKNPLAAGRAVREAEQAAPPRQPDLTWDPSRVDVAGAECFPLWVGITQFNSLGHLRANGAAVSC